MAFRCLFSACSARSAPDRLRDALTDVIANAIQYNVDGGRVRIEVRERERLAEIVVSDTGIGIPPQQLPHVFEPFFRGDPARSREAGGAGLGLAVTRSIVARPGGDVRCASEPGRGTTITIGLPRAPLSVDSRPKRIAHEDTKTRAVSIDYVVSGFSRTSQGPPKGGHSMQRETGPWCASWLDLLRIRRSPKPGTRCR
jgi:anti-sigma regulatory factor (Ser/Thr protein kinase)